MFIHAWPSNIEVAFERFDLNASQASLIGSSYDLQNGNALRLGLGVPLRLAFGIGSRVGFRVILMAIEPACGVGKLPSCYGLARPI